MNELTVANNNLPSNIEDLSKFVLVGREQLVAVRAAIRAIDKVGVAQEVRKQKLKEGQEIGEAVLDAEVRIGELMRDVPKASGGDRRSENFKTANGGHFETKTEAVAKMMGMDAAADKNKVEHMIKRFETLAAHPEIVAQAKAEARENDTIVTRADVLEMVRKPHVAYNSGNNEWYTPGEYIEAARSVMGEINLDPASSEIANKTVKADHIYTVEDNGLEKPWFGNVWLNPPYATDLIGKFAEKVVNELGNINQAIVLVNNATETEWFYGMVTNATAVCFPKSRVKFYTPDGKTGAPLQGQAIIYFGEYVNRFIKRYPIQQHNTNRYRRRHRLSR